MKGTVKYFNNTTGFGFIIADEENKDIFVHRSNLKTPDRNIIEGQRVDFEITKGPRGLEAVNVKIVE